MKYVTYQKCKPYSALSNCKDVGLNSYVFLLRGLRNIRVGTEISEE